MSDLIDELQWRGLVKQHTDLEALRAALNEGSVTFYCGFDPTAASLHHGHLVQLIMMRHLQLAGHHPIALVGGATGLIGDPRMTAERQLQDKETVSEWVEKLKIQIGKFLDFDGANPARMVNNRDWTEPLSAIDLLRDLGKHFRMGTMLAKDAVARRLKSEEGISYTEFSYQILQANDFLQLYRKYGATLETGGNDQWGNLVGGMDLIRKVEGADVHVMTTPLITKSDGTKFGKSEGGAIWLDPEMLSPYAFYQFWLNVEDADVIHFLKVFTFMSREEIEDLERQTAENPGARAAQKALAEAVTALVHGAEETSRVKAASAALFGSGDLREVNGDTLVAATADLPHAPVKIGETTILDLLVTSGLEKGVGAAKRTIASGGAYINNEKVADEGRVVTQDDVLPGKVVLFRRGKRLLGVGRTN
ncbi:tyrosine--tRNA ligase [Mobiluncus mulieris]|uniref:Tyrosine--tRNA ligase n=2 Tax=Mobiluncus mulieris TaxID=2052 RepID=E0QSC6_9ACTO|nr:tyrosine--tRNA ligase [Mobiluncus mulieris]EEJ53848.1 tyrosine--tRNA ligase [Mobiluncus mulieris ATCC 35243]EEZ91649.1 tyrosine--tRNA ligase [Mobiluncus mulieris 28-1]EFM45501.1 tyrosine--tRNA ligase [Mobiluncus mulieris ATCC 35239]EFN93767.1 tyrosine--tRNA ligase [Mobiluncus mulieris FB024-16]MBB5845825.1 tyrosyl-tRNA synthetase [Mobiluncus mulieris]